MTTFDEPGALRRIRRIADMSQRELARAVGVSGSTIGHAETGMRHLTVDLLSRAAALAGLRLALVDGNGEECLPMRSDSVRDRGDRRFPAHLDTRYGDDDWWHGPHRYAREQPWFTFDRDRRTRDRYTRRNGTPDDHDVPRPGDSPYERAEARRREYWRQRIEERERRFLAGELSGIDGGLICTCVAECDQLDDFSGRPVHAEDCPCSCDVG